MRTRGRSAVVVSVLFGCGTIWACSLQSPSEDELFRGSSAGSPGNAGSAGSGGDAGSAGSGGNDQDGGGGSSGDSGDGGSDADTPDAPFNPQQGLILHYKFDQTTGPSILDSSGSNGIGQLINVPTDGPSPFVIGRFNNALKLAGTDDSAVVGPNEQFVELPDNLVQGLSEVTVAAWFRWDGTQQHERLFDIGGGPGNWFYFSPVFDPSLSRIGIRNPRTNKWIDVVGSGAPAGEWTHVAVTWSAEAITLYLNGTRDTSVAPLLAGADGIKDTEPTLPSAIEPTTQSFIGKSQFQGQSGLGNDPPFNGLIDEFRIYNRALTAAEVAKLEAMSE